MVLVAARLTSPTSPPTTYTRSPIRAAPISCRAICIGARPTHPPPSPASVMADVVITDIATGTTIERWQTWDGRHMVRRLYWSLSNAATGACWANGKCLACLVRRHGETGPCRRDATGDNIQ